MLRKYYVCDVLKTLQLWWIWKEIHDSKVSIFKFVFDLPSSLFHTIYDYLLVTADAKYTITIQISIK